MASGFVGYVLRFKVRSEFLSHYDIKNVGSSLHQEYWIPAEDLEALNGHIDGVIELVAEYHL